MYKYRIENILLNDGTEIKPGPLTIIVGPNNCGKSRILKDIKSITSDQNPNSIIVKELDYSLPDSVDDLVESYKIKTFNDANNNLHIRTLSSNLVSPHSVHVGVDWKQNCSNWLNQKNSNTKKNFSHWFGSFFVSLFETEDRLRIIKESDSSERGVTGNLLQAFYNEGVSGALPVC